MTRIVIIGAGITGMAAANVLVRNFEVTIVARDLPGDDPTIQWASPWAGASFIAGDCSIPERDRKMQFDSFKQLCEFADSSPESSVGYITCEDFYEDESLVDKIWWKSMPEFQFLPLDKLPKGARVGISYRSVVLNPNRFLPWFRDRLKKLGVQFERMSINAISDVQKLDPDVIINATGLGSTKLADVQDSDLYPIRGQTIIVKSDYDKIFIRDDGKYYYTYVIPRLDGTAIMGGIRQPDSEDNRIFEEQTRDILKRINENMPDQFSADIADYEVVGYNVGLRPSRKSGIRVEKEFKNESRIVHVYGFTGGGYIYGFGAANIVKELVDEILA